MTVRKSLVEHNPREGRKLLELDLVIGCRAALSHILVSKRSGVSWQLEPG